MAKPAFERLFRSKTPEEVDRDPAYRQVQREMKPLRDAIIRGASPASQPAWECGGHDDALLTACKAHYRRWDFMSADDKVAAMKKVEFIVSTYLAAHGVGFRPASPAPQTEGK